MSKEFETADLTAAAKALGCEGQLKYQLSQRTPIKVSAIENPLVAQALTGTVSFDPYDRNSNGRSYEGMFSLDSRKRGLSSQDKERESFGSIMKTKPRFH